MEVCIRQRNSRNDEGPYVILQFDISKSTIQCNGTKPIGKGRLPPLVCKQFWAETMHNFFSSTDFRVDDVAALLKLAISPSHRAVVSRIQRIKFRSRVYLWDSSWKFDSDMAGTFTTSIIGKFASLVGLEWDLVLVEQAVELGQVADIMGDARWKSLRLPAILRALQQHKLREDLTTVLIHQRRYPGLGPSKTTALGSTIRGYLLQYAPLRTSRRGKGDA